MATSDTPAGIGHNSPPKDRSFKRRWASAIFDCTDPKKPVGAVAMAFRLYHDMDGEGRGIAATDLNIAQSCGVSDRSVRTFKGWLVSAGFVKILARGGRGGQTEYQACIPGNQPEEFSGQMRNEPADFSGQCPIQPEIISGKKRLNRQPFPAIETELPEMISGQTVQPEKSAGQIVATRAVVSNNIYNNINNLPSLPTQLELSAAREGEEIYPGGVFVNCQTIRHAGFSISIPAIQMGIRAGMLPADEIKRRCLAHALQWAEEIEHGKRASDVVPNKISNFLIRTIMNDINAEECGEVRKTRARGVKAIRPDGSHESEVDRIQRMVSEATARQTGRRLV